MATTVCRNCGRALADSDNEFDSLADTPGARQPPEAAGLLAGATPFDAEAGKESGPVEYQEDGLCLTCRSQGRREER
jgi:hypothetical protein